MFLEFLQLAHWHVCGVDVTVARDEVERDALLEDPNVSEEIVMQSSLSVFSLPPVSFLYWEWCTEEFGVMESYRVMSVLLLMVCEYFWYLKNVYGRLVYYLLRVVSTAYRHLEADDLQQTINDGWCE